MRGCKEFCRLVYQIHDAGRGKAAGRKSRGPRHVKYEYVSVDLYLAPPISSCILEGGRGSGEGARHVALQPKRASILARGGGSCRRGLQGGPPIPFELARQLLTTGLDNDRENENVNPSCCSSKDERCFSIEEN